MLIIKVFNTEPVKFKNTTISTEGQIVAVTMSTILTLIVILFPLYPIVRSVLKKIVRKLFELICICQDL